MILKLTEEEKVQHEEIMRAALSRQAPIYTQLAKCLPGSAESMELTKKMLSVRYGLHKELLDFNKTASQHRIDLLIKEGRQALIDSGKEQIMELIQYFFGAAKRHRARIENPHSRSASNEAFDDEDWFSGYDIIFFTTDPVNDPRSVRWDIKETTTKIYEDSIRAFVFKEMQPYNDALTNDEKALNDLKAAYNEALIPFYDFTIESVKPKKPDKYKLPADNATKTLYTDLKKMQLQPLVDGTRQSNLYALSGAPGFLFAAGADAKHIDYYDLAAYSAFCTLYTAGNKSITITQICNVMNGKGASGKPSKEQKEAVEKSIAKQRFTQCFYKGAEALTVEDTYFLPVRRKTQCISGTLVSSFILLDTPPLYKYSSAVNQIGTFDPGVNNWPLNHTAANISLGIYLLQRIDGMTRGNKDLPDKITYENIYNKYKEGKDRDKQEKTTPNRNEKLDARSASKKMLKYWKGLGIISGFRDYPAGSQQKTGIIIDITKQRQEAGKKPLTAAKKTTAKKK